jgi:hypothetical protein
MSCRGWDAASDTIHQPAQGLLQLGPLRWRRLHGNINHVLELTAIGVGVLRGGRGRDLGRTFFKALKNMGGTCHALPALATVPFRMLSSDAVVPLMGYFWPMQPFVFHFCFVLYVLLKAAGCW